MRLEWESPGWRWMTRGLPLHASAAAKRMAVAVCCLLAFAGCASLPDAEREMSRTEVVTFKAAHGPVSASKSAEIIEGLERKSGDTDILQKHLAVEQAINIDRAWRSFHTFQPGT